MGATKERPMTYAISLALEEFAPTLPLTGGICFRHSVVKVQNSKIKNRSTRSGNKLISFLELL